MEKALPLKKIPVIKKPGGFKIFREYGGPNLNGAVFQSLIRNLLEHHISFNAYSPTFYRMTAKVLQQDT